MASLVLDLSFKLKYNRLLHLLICIREEQHT